MKEALRRFVGFAVWLGSMAVITLLSSAILTALWMALIWVGHFAARVLPAWLVSTARYAVWAFALLGMATLGVFIFLMYEQAAVLWAYKALGIQKQENAPGKPPTPGE
jgi:carbon starvation protein CstA